MKMPYRFYYVVDSFIKTVEKRTEVYRHEDYPFSFDRFRAFLIPVCVILLEKSRSVNSADAQFAKVTLLLRFGLESQLSPANFRPFNPQS